MAQYISSPSKTAEILKEFDIRLRKNLGQNFLVDTNILKKIMRISGIQENETVLEIGSGIGSLTEVLLEAAKKIICVELDKRLTGVFTKILGKYTKSRIVLIEEDAMKLDYSLLAEKHHIKKIVSNLPYKIAAPLILKILLEAPGIEKMYLTIQRDIASRLIAKEGDKNYSSYSVKANFLADFKILFNIQKTSFIPAPHVGSVFIEASRKVHEFYSLNNAIQNPVFSSEQTKRFFDFIDSCFRHRRKKMINSLENSGNAFVVDKIDLMIKMLHGIGKDKDIRAEELKLQEFLTLFLCLESKNL